MLLPPASVRRPRCCSDRNTRSGLVRQTTRSDAEAVEVAGRLEYLGHDRANSHEGDLFVDGGMAAEPVAARDRMPAAALGEHRILGDRRQLGIDRPGAQPEVRRRATGPTDQ